MGSKDELKEIDMKNCACYYFDGVIKDIDINFSDVLWDKKFRLLHIKFNKIDEFIRVRMVNLDI